MIALDTNAVVRMVIEDDENQAKTVQEVVAIAEKNSVQMIILSEVLIETVWVLESVYRCTREDISQFLEVLISTSTFTFPDSTVIRNAAAYYKKGGDFADLLIVFQARKCQAKKFFSFDKNLQKKFPHYVVEKLNEADL
jgi:predicted nucleic-acid-binding protein